MTLSHSPLRYPGGKQILAHVLAHLMRLNGARGGTYIEPYAGGAGAALNLLIGEQVDRVVINDADKRVYFFWKAVLERTDAFCHLIRTTPLSVHEWRRQRLIYQHPHRHSFLRAGFATFYLNRCNRSGIIGNGGPIGGIDQRGEWKIDARFNRGDLERRVRRVGLYHERISISNLDAIEFLSREVASLPSDAKPFVYLDPPYFAKGRELYLNHYLPNDHAKLAKYLQSEARFAWVMSYDNTPQITRLYRGMRRVPFDLNYSARDRRTGREIMISKPGMVFPRKWRRGIPGEYITAAARVSITDAA